MTFFCGGFGNAKNPRLPRISIVSPQVSAYADDVLGDLLSVLYGTAKPAPFTGLTQRQS